MGISTDAIIAYGVDLGDHLSDISFSDEDQEEIDNEGLSQFITDKLLVAKGFIETDWKSEGYWQRKHRAEADLGIDLITYSSYEEPYYILGTRQHVCYRGDAMAISPEDLIVQDDWNTNIKWALEILGIEPKSPPQWYLSVVWG